jgi:hypothetical protein
MNVVKFILRLIGWLVTIILQIVASFAVILLFSIIFAGVDTISRPGWLILLFGIWLGYVVGINLVGQAALRWFWKDFHVLTVQRLVSSMIGAVLPLLVLIGIGLGIPVGDVGTDFYDIVTSHWQPILAQASLFTAIVGYYLPEFFKRNRTE